MAETTVLGAALAAGKGVGIWKDLSSVTPSSLDVFAPSDNSQTG